MMLAERLTAALSASGSGLLAADLDDAEMTSAIPRRDAAVLLAVTDRAEPGVLLTQRTDALRHHAGQVAFPGGRIDPGDDGPVAAALREAWEEIALPPDHVRIVATLDRYRTATGFDITPVLAAVPADLPLRAEPGEVDAIFEVPLAWLLNPANLTPASAVWQGRTRHYLELHFDGRRIWGATAAIIANLARRLAWT